MSHEHKKYFGGWILTLIIVLLFAGVVAGICIAGTSGGPDEDESFVIGVLLPLTGDNSSCGQELKRGIEIAVERLADEGRPVHVVYRDTGSDVSAGMRALLELNEEYNSDEDNRRMPVVIGPANASIAEKTGTMAELLGINMISLATTEAMNQYTRYNFKFVPSEKTLAKGVLMMAEQADPGDDEILQILVVYNPDSSGVSLADAVKSEAAELFEKREIAYEVIEYPLSYSMLKTAVEIQKYFYQSATEDEYLELLTLGEESEYSTDVVSPDFIYVVAPDSEYYLYVYLMIISSTPEVQSSVWAGSEQILSGTDIEYFAETDTLTLVPQRATNSWYKTQYETMFETAMPSYTESVYGYDALMVVAEVIQAYGTDAAAISEGLKRVRYIGMTGLVDFNEDGSRTSGYSLYHMDENTHEWTALNWSEYADLVTEIQAKKPVSLDTLKNYLEKNLLS